MADEVSERLLQHNGFAHLASIGPIGKPQSHIVWYDWDGSHLNVSTTKDRQKYKNIRKDPNVSLSVMDPEDPYTYVEVRGTVVSIDDDVDNRLIDSLAQKYLGQEKYGWDPPDAKRVVIKIRPRHIRVQST